MPLTPTLLARLKRRGILKDDANEEVIAESYDTEAITSAPKQNEGTAYAMGCPNKWNPYHQCVQFCYAHWKDGTSEKKLPRRYLEQRIAILKKYPLPIGWKEVYDPGCARHYYWCPRTDEVSWLSPRHPLAVIGDAAPKVSKEIYNKGENRSIYGMDLTNSDDKRKVVDNDESRNRSGTVYRDDSKRKRKHQDSDSEGSIASDASNSGEERRPELTDRDKLKRAKRKGIDPMDPAAYGDHVPVGTWSTGLHAHDKTGADVTASGPLFQQRPYPAPGAVLRKQQQQR